MRNTYMNDYLKGKQILLLYARFFGYDRIVKEKLEQYGALVDLYDARANIGSFQKAIRKVNDYPYRLKQIRFHTRIQKINRLKSYDYIFCNDILDKKILARYRAIFPNAIFILYLDDSVNNIKGIEETFSFYDRVLTFDNCDAEKYGIVLRPLFYSDCFYNLSNLQSKELFDISFIGTSHSDRLKVINSIVDNNNSLKLYLYCYLQSWFMYYYYFLFDREYRKVKKEFFRFTPLSMNQVARIMHDSRTILDIHHPNQSGLTMRTIETLGLKKKLITTNSNILNYDFYDERNILVIDRDNPIVPLSFINNDYNEISQNLYEKYSLSGWINDVFVSYKDKEL